MREKKTPFPPMLARAHPRREKKEKTLAAKPLLCSLQTLNYLPEDGLGERHGDYVG